MGSIRFELGLVLAGVLFAIGLLGLLSRRNLVFVLIALEVMLNAAGLAFVVAGARWGQPDGQVMFVFVLAMGAAEVAIGLSLLMRLQRVSEILDSDALNETGE